MPRFDERHPAEELLYERGLINRRSVQQRELLKCIGYRWAQAEAEGCRVEFYPLQLARCTGLMTGTVYPIIHRLASTGVMILERETVNSSNVHLAPRTFYLPAATELGEEFRRALTSSHECPLD